jgi:uncharacterized FAD-dependent dehydrogenase
MNCSETNGHSYHHMPHENVNSSLFAKVAPPSANVPTNESLQQMIPVYSHAAQGQTTQYTG